MPNYITGGLAEFALPPYELKNLVSATFILDADDDKLRNICDKFLNGPLGRSPATGFIPGGDNRVIMACSTFPDVAAPTQSFGFSIYSEVTLLFSVFDQKNEWWSWYVPVLYLDGPRYDVGEWQAELPIAVGRELYGLPKTRAEIDIDPVAHTGTVKPLDPATPGQSVTVSEAVTISLNGCAIATIDDELAVAETELLEFVIAERRATTSGRAPRRRGSRRKVAKLTAAAAELRASSASARAAQEIAATELLRLHRQRAARRILTPTNLIDMLWGGDPYGNVGRDPPPEAQLLENLGFIRKPTGRARRQGLVTKKKVPRTLMLQNPGPGSAPEFEFQVDFRLLGLRQLHDPTNVPLATVQQVVRTQLLFDRLPWSPIQTYCVKIKDSLATPLGIVPQQTLLADRVYAYTGAKAWFGNAASFVV